jgi:hypothetical protein
MKNFYNVNPTRGRGVITPFVRPVRQNMRTGDGLHCALSTKQGLAIQLRLHQNFHLQNLQSAMQSMGLLHKAYAPWLYIVAQCRWFFATHTSKINVKLNNNLCNKLLQLF